MASSHVRLHRQDTAVWTELATSRDCLRLKISKQFVQSRNAVWTESCLVLTQFTIRTQRGYLLWCYLETGSRVVHKCFHTAEEMAVAESKRGCGEPEVLNAGCRRCITGIVIKAEDDSRRPSSCNASQLSPFLVLLFKVNEYTSAHNLFWQIYGQHSPAEVHFAITTTDSDMTLYETEKLYQ